LLTKGVLVMVQSTVGRVSSVIDLESEIEAEFRNRLPVHEPRPVTFAPPRVREPTVSMPDYVEHREGATEIGKLTAEAIVGEYEAAAKDIEAMGAELIERVKQCEAMTRDALAVTQEMKETAMRYREEAKRIFVQIEDCSLITAEVRKTCTELKERIAVSATA
jgi:chromatin segregation and condensation protein Rec8/ScpA/Scc1 (kleisin family)